MFLVIFDPCSSIVMSVFDCYLSDVLPLPGASQTCHSNPGAEIFMAPFDTIPTKEHMYGKCPKLLNTYTFLFLFANKMLVIRAGSHKMLV